MTCEYPPVNNLSISSEGGRELANLDGLALRCRVTGFRTRVVSTQNAGRRNAHACLGPPLASKNSAKLVPKLQLKAFYEGWSSYATKKKYKRKNKNKKE